MEANLIRLPGSGPAPGNYEPPASSAEPEATPSHATDLVVIDLDVTGDLDSIRRLASGPDAPVIMVVAGRGLDGFSLEYTLTLAELRGASFCLPKPVAADEISATNIVAMDRRRRAPAALSHRTADALPGLRHVRKTG